MNKAVDLYLIGTGINGLRQISVEALETLRRCRKVFHTTNHHKELLKVNRNAVDLASMYWTDEPRGVVYRRLAGIIKDEVRKGPGVASVIYGHPLFFDDIHMTLLKWSKRNGVRCVSLAGISSLDTLSIDLEVDFGEGLQLFESNDLVINKLALNPALHTLVFQLGEFGTETTTDSPSEKSGRFKRLERHLRKFYPAEQRIVIVFSDDGDGAYLLKSRLNKLDTHRHRAFLGTTLYLPPLDE